jgi:hypothetical protein
LLGIELRGVEYFRVGGAVAPFAVEKGVRAEMDDGAHFEILPFDLLRRGFDVRECLGMAPCGHDQNEHDQDERDNFLPPRSDSHAQIVTLKEAFDPTREEAVSVPPN